jgi:hypothetical protein
MASEKIGDMTRDELEDFVIKVIAKRFREYPYVQKSDRPLSDVLASMRKHILKVQPGEPSTLELLREDRDR